MIIYLYLILINSYGFSTNLLTLNNFLSFDLDENQYFFQIPSTTTNDLYINLTNEFQTITYTSIKGNRYYEIKGSKILFFTLKNSYQIDFLVLPKNTCSNIKISIRLDSYMYLDSFLNEENSSLCTFYYRPKRDYRVFTDCISTNRDSQCSLLSDSILTGSNPVVCLSNTTCDDTFSNGFLLKSLPYQNSKIQTKTKISVIKGANHGTYCEFHYVYLINISGIYHNINNNLNISKICKPQEESVQVALLLISLLLVLIITGALIYYQCKPNREVYVDSDGIDNYKFLNNSKLLKPERVITPNGLSSSKWL